MEFEVLGPVRLRHADRDSALSGRLQRILLAMLLVHAGRPVPADVLTDVLWADVTDRRSEQNLRLHVHRLRRALGDADRLTFESGGYRMTVLPGELDAERFESLVDEATQIAEQEPQRCVDLLRKALSLWRGRAYEGLDIPIVADEAERLNDRRLTAIEQLYEAELAGGRDATIVSELTDLVRRNPLRERLHALLMTALYRAGRQSEALQVYQNVRRTLVDELGLEPGPELRAIEQRVLAGEPVELTGSRGTVPSVPAQLPANIRGFVGRDDELAALDATITGTGDAVRIATLTGTAGVGKTALAVRWAHRVRDRFPDGQLYVDLRGYGPDGSVSPDDALAGFLRAFGVEGSAIPQVRDERAARYRSLLDDRRVLVVLDNARTVDQVRPLLPGSPDNAVLITSRDVLTGLGAREGAQRINLDRMSPAESRRLMIDLLGNQATEDDALDELIGQCARLPLALRIAADLVDARPARGVAGLVAELADERDRLDLLDVDDDPYSAVRAVFSWSYQQLSRQTALVFRMCGLHPGHGVDAHALAALTGSETRSVRRSLDVLVRTHLIDESADGHYRTHDLLRAYAKELAESTDDAADRTKALARLADHYLQIASKAMDQVAPSESDRRPQVTVTAAMPTFSGYDSARAWLDRERSNLLAVLEVASGEYASTLSGLLRRYLEMGGFIDDALALHERALEAARHRGDPVAEAHEHRYLSTVAFHLGDYDGSVAHDERALDLYRRSGDSWSQALTLNNMGTTEVRRGRFREALERYEQAINLHRESDEEPSTALLSNLGSLHRTLGDYDRALHYLNQALSGAEESDDRYGAGLIFSFLADTYTSLGRFDDAIRYGRQALEVGRSIGVPLLEADALDQLGRAYRRLGDYDRSLEATTDALEIVRAGNYPSSVAELLCAIAETRRLSGDPSGAPEALHEALEIVVDTGDRYVEAEVRVGLGDLHADLAENDRAREYWQCALEIWTDLGVPEADDVRAKLDALQRE